MFGGASRNRLRGNRLTGNGYAAQGSNFGIGLVTATDTANVIEDNTATGNTNGLFIAAGVQGNVFRRNLIVGNPPVQVDVDHPANTWTTLQLQGLDIKSLADESANTFENNVCLTSINAPCPALTHSRGH